jgi:hypothetical protein
MVLIDRVEIQFVKALLFWYELIIYWPQTTLNVCADATLVGMDLPHITSVHRAYTNHNINVRSY